MLSLGSKIVVQQVTHGKYHMPSTQTSENFIFLSAHAQKRLFYNLKVAIKTSPHVRQSPTMADSNATPSRSVPSRPSWQFLEAPLLRKAGEILMLTGRRTKSFCS